MSWVFAIKCVLEMMGFGPKTSSAMAYTFFVLFALGITALVVLSGLILLYAFQMARLVL